MLLSCNQNNPSLGRIIVPLAAGLLILSTLARSPAQAEENAPVKPQTTTYVISANEGYGVIDCLVDGVECGRVVADSWCEAHGQSVATAFGLASDVTGSIGEPAPKHRPDDVLVTCRD